MTHIGFFIPYHTEDKLSELVLGTPVHRGFMVGAELLGKEKKLGILGISQSPRSERNLSSVSGGAVGAGVSRGGLGPGKGMAGTPHACA